MGTCMILASLLMALMSTTSANSANIPSKSQDLLNAMEEMQKANYFTFVMLTNMSPVGNLQGNITFLMPNDRMLSKTLMPENSISEFLLQHSIPFPLLFDYLVHFPTGSMVPTSKLGCMLKVSNNGRRSFYLNNVKIIRPNVCTSGSSIRCHGIDGVISVDNSTLPIPSCSNCSSPISDPAPPALSSPWLPPPPPEGSDPAASMTAPPPIAPHHASNESGSLKRQRGVGSCGLLMSFLLLPMLGF